jgi:hypothetical protein
MYTLVYYLLEYPCLKSSSPFEIATDGSSIFFNFFLLLLPFISYLIQSNSNILLTFICSHLILKDLPPEYQSKLKKAGLTLEDCEEHLAPTLSILHFLYKRKFKLKKSLDEKLEETVEKREIGDGEAFETTVQVEILDGPEETSNGAKSPIDSVPTAIFDEITPDDLAREARSITEGDPLTLFTKFVSHGQGYVSF